MAQGVGMLLDIRGSCKIATEYKCGRGSAYLRDVFHVREMELCIKLVRFKMSVLRNAVSIN